MREVKNWFRERMVNRVLSALKDKGFNAYYAMNKDEALKIILNLIPKDAIVGVGGSITVREIGLIEALNEKKIPVIHHWRKGLSREENFRVRRLEVTSDVFISSCNAITIDGKIICADAVGNRVAALSFGPRKVIIVTGINKIVKDVNSGIWRIRNIATPMNAKRLKLNIPCAEHGYCTECNSINCPVRIILIIDRPPRMTDYHIIIVDEELGY